MVSLLGIYYNMKYLFQTYKLDGSFESEDLSKLLQEGNLTVVTNFDVFYW